MTNKLLSLPCFITIELFSFFGEYFFIVILSYTLIVIILVTYNIYGLLIQKAFSECVVLILCMVIYLIFNDNLLLLHFLNLNNSFVNDYFAFVAKIFICFFSVVYFLITSDFLKKQKLILFEYVLIILFCILGLLVLCNSNDLLISYLTIELASLSFYILASFKKNSIYSVESGIKYFIVGAISSAFFLLGSSFLYGFSGSVNFLNFQEIFNCSYFYFNFYENSYFYLGFLELGLTLVLFSLFIKLSLAPFHLYTLDIYEGSPTSSAFFFAVITKLSIFVLLIRLCYQSFFSLKNCWQFYSLLLGSFSIFIGSFGGILQRKIKTLLAYSSTTHMGFILIAFSTTSFTGIQMLLIYLFIYSVSSVIIWSVLLLIQLKKFESKYNKELIDLALLKKSNNVLSLIISLCMFSIAGIPPLVGFLTKMNIFLSVVGISFCFVAIINIISSVISTFYYI